MTADVVVYAATPSGIMAAIEAGRLGKKVILLEPTTHIGGMPASGLGTSDIGNINAIGGLAKEFFAAVAAIYGSTWSVHGTLYEPHVARQAFEKLLTKQANVQLVTNAVLSSIIKDGGAIKSLATVNGYSYTAKEFIDASYEGSLMAAAGVSYVVGREASTQYNESYAGVQVDYGSNGVKIDPYVVPGVPSSGLIRHIQAYTPTHIGSGDSGVMAYNYRLCLTQDPDNRIPFTAPVNYDPSEFELFARSSEAMIAKGNTPTVQTFFVPVGIPNEGQGIHQKFDVNNSSDLSTDEVGESSDYPDGTLQVRQAIAAEHKRYIQALLYFLQTSTRLPASVNSAVAEYGYCKDEFTDNGGFPYQLYVREGRRMLGAYVMTQHDVVTQSAPNSIGLASDTMDSHAVHRYPIDDQTNNEGTTVYKVAIPYPIAYGSLVPKSSEATNLLVTICVSASHVAFSSMRMEPVYMIMGQSAGAAASLAIDEATSVQNVSYPALSTQLLADGQILSWNVGARVGVSPIQ
ncbi:FAD-dependent oxidoreductase [Nevskia soli]|uniref:FAD-dependent oxidoreductase n=1 Tax=Nevskia soli TaxID=418856 RepID=UPI00248118D9|nr:FAD-dependent oxidoreductase [Nevskia soli]